MHTPLVDLNRDEIVAVAAIRSIAHGQGPPRPQHCVGGLGAPCANLDSVCLTPAPSGRPDPRHDKEQGYETHPKVPYLWSKHFRASLDWPYPHLHRAHPPRRDTYDLGRTAVFDAAKAQGAALAQTPRLALA